VTIFHSPIAATDAALPLIRSHWKGPIGIYPEAERKDYVAVHKDANEPDHVSPEEFVAKAKSWVSQGVQIIWRVLWHRTWHIQPLREALLKRLPSAA
jgi:hypothetical protein